MALTGLTGDPIHWGDKGLDIGASEWLQNIIAPNSPRDASGGSNIAAAIAGKTNAQQPQQTPPPMSSQISSPTTKTTTNPNPNPKTPAGTATVPSSVPTNTNNIIDDSAKKQQDAAAAAAEAKRKAAEGRYNAQRGISEQAKGSAKSEYDWLVDTLGSNKKDSLDQIALNQTQGEADYASQETKTTAQYDKAKQDILSTYRDLQVQQEKILRGGGMGSSSRSQEAALKLNNLLGKDMGTVTTNEADSLAAIGTALSYFQKQITLTKNQVETETKGKLDKAALDYDNQVKAIDANMTLSASEREDAFANAEVQLAQDTQAIQQWATGLKTQAAETQAKNTESINTLVNNMLDANADLGKTIDEKKTLTNKTLTDMGYNALDENPTVTDPTSGVYQNMASYGTKDELDQAYQEGKVSPAEYQRQLSQIQLKTQSAAPTTSAVASTGTQTADPLIQSLLNRTV